MFEPAKKSSKPRFKTPFWLPGDRSIITKKKYLPGPRMNGQGIALFYLPAEIRAESFNPCGGFLGYDLHKHLRP